MNFVSVGVPEDVLGKLREIVTNDFEHALVLIGPKTEQEILKIAKNKYHAVGGMFPVITRDYWGDENGDREWRVELMMGHTGTSVLTTLKLPDMECYYRNFGLKHETIYYFD